MHAFRTILIAWLLVGVPAAWGADALAPPPMRQVTLDALIQQALTHSPAIQAKRRAYEAARAKVFSEWLPDDPEVGVDVEGQSRMFRFRSRSDREYSISQTIPFPTTLWLRGRMAAREAEVAYWQYKEQERDVAWHIEQPYYELRLATKTLVTLQEVGDLLQRLSRTVQARYETNQAAQQDVLKVQIEQSRNELEQTEWREREHLAHAHLAHILGEPLLTRYVIEQDAELAQPLAMSHDELEQLARHARPELRALEAGIKRAKVARALAVTSWLPDVTGHIEARQFPGEGSSRQYDTFVGLTVPVWSLVKGVGGRWRSAQRDEQAAEAMYQEMTNEVLLAIHEAYSKITVAEHAVAMYDHVILPQARQQVSVTLSAYEAGREEFLSLIDAQRMLRDAQMAAYKAHADREMGLADLRLAIGGVLPAPAASVAQKEAAR